ncbi:MAG: tetratricopeptide repeat protein, partial [Proteobacteria bacterium]|nr:tetratricopeptide repeat protein [Pseudomonadota bacterium]
HVHHYCYAIDKINTYRKTNDKKVLRSSIFEFDYVLAKEDPKNRINYKIAFAKGRVLLLLNENPEDKNEAMKSFYLSIKLNNRYSKAYIAISNMYLENGNVEMAMKILKQGLEKNPQSKNLKAAINKIGKH